MCCRFTRALTNVKNYPGTSRVLVLSIRESTSLVSPQHRQVLPQLLQTQAVGFVTAQDHVDNVRREASQAEHASDVGAVAAHLLGQIFEAGVLARFELGLPAVALGDGFDGVADFPRLDSNVQSGG